MLFNSGTPVMLEGSGSSSSNVDAWSVDDACAWIDSNQLGDERVLSRTQEQDLGVVDAAQADEFLNALDELKGVHTDE
ncbi:hypothetical protein HDU78_000692 [Chytriomyces hyalinus]|nr:hypothetical protein HDU78_000692 [Chytriomyces hyalinus]